ncbi:MAG: hypothetical protein EZS28_016100, partial [Streblomastix strix]
TFKSIPSHQQSITSLSTIYKLSPIPNFEYDALLLLKADKTQLIDLYSKTEDDALLLLKANIADLTNYVDLTSAQTIVGYKQFGVINVSSISKLSKNDASILLACGGDMLVSSLVTQPQLQEVRDIATGKSNAYAFSTQEELNDWMAVQDNVAKFVIGDNLYNVDKEVTEYWWDGIDLKVLETELPDMSNVIKTFGAATGGNNTITDISIDGNTLTPAKNKNFVDKDYDQNINGQKTFNTTIHSVGIMVKTYDNSKDDSLLLLNADKTQLIDSYTKGETNNLLNNKADNGVSYYKSETDARDEVYTKSEDDTPLLAKANTGVCFSKSETYTGDEIYTKSENDALLLLKADKTQLIDQNTKSQDEALQLLKADKTQMIDSYTKVEPDNLQNIKADNGVYYTKGEDDQLISQIDTSNVDLITGSSFIKQGTDDTVVLLGDYGTKPIAEFGGSVDDSNYVKKTGQATQILRKDEDDVSLSEDEDDYLTRAAVYNNFVSRSDNQMIYDTKTFNSNVNATGFVKTGQNGTSVLLGGGGDQLLSLFGGVQVEGNFYTLMMEIQPKTQICTTTATVICSIGTYSTGISPPTPPSTTYPISLATKRKTLTCVHSFRDIRISIDSSTPWRINDAIGVQFSWML